MILVTGGCGFIGSNFILNWLKCHDEAIVNLDCKTYAGSGNQLDGLDHDERYIFSHVNLTDRSAIKQILERYKPRAIIHFAAESHVDRSIDDAEIFISTNIVGTFNLLEEARSYWNTLLLDNKKTDFRFIHISTDEVFGSLDIKDAPFTETSRYKPNSPYSASKAASDHLVRSYYKTYDFPAIISNCSNNYGPFQFKEKLIPLTIKNCIEHKPIPIYGSGLQVRDWLHVHDHCDAIEKLLFLGRVGETYNIGGQNEIKNIEVVNQICGILDKLMPSAQISSYIRLINHVEDRLGHDYRYAIDSSKIHDELNWCPQHKFSSGLYSTIKWYLANSHFLLSGEAA